MAHTEIRFTGFGGQGIILAGHITGLAASIYEDKQATLTQNYGPESRGGACSAQLIIADQPIFYPNISTPDIVVAMSQEAYEKYEPTVPENGTLIVEENLVKLTHPKRGYRLLQVPATKLADSTGKKVVANIVMLGFFTAVTGAVARDAMSKAIAASVPEGTEQLNFRAFELGFEHGAKLTGPACK
jgi:2-oxoglutarate ferredoxin oxidoreductase subunit gamma